MRKYLLFILLMLFIPAIADSSGQVGEYVQVGGGYLGSSATRDAADDLDGASELPDSAAIKAYGNANWQPLHAYLTDIAGITANSGDVIYFNGTNWVDLAPDAGKYLKSGMPPVWDTPAPGFDTITSGTNTIANMIVGNGSALTWAGTGWINARHFRGITSVDSVEFGYLNGVTSSIQTQFAGKQPLATPLTTISALGAVADNEFLVGTGAGTYAYESESTVLTTLGLDGIASAITSGAYLVGFYDDLVYSDADNVQDALADLDFAIGNPTVYSEIRTGRVRFNSTSGREVFFRQPPMDDTDYNVFTTNFTQAIDAGEISIEDKTTTGFTLKNSGANSVNYFEYIAVPYTLRGSTQQQGTDTFNSTTGVTVSLSPNLADTNYDVIISLPSQTLIADIGAISVEDKAVNQFVVKNSGADAVTTFNWLAVPYDLGGEIDWTGTENFNTPTGVTVTIGGDVGNVSYVVLITCASQTNIIDVGVVSVESKSQTEFVVKNSGSGTSEFEWRVFPQVAGASDMFRSVYDVDLGGYIDLEAGGLNANVFGYTGLLAVSGGVVSEVDSLVELQAQIADMTAAGSALLDDADASAQRTTLGLGSAATRDAADDLDGAGELPDSAAIKAYGDTNWGRYWTRAGDDIYYNDGNVVIGATSSNAPLEIVGAKPAGHVGGFHSGMLHIRGDGTVEFSSSVITGHSSYNTNTQLWYLGSSSVLNNDIAFINRQDADLFFSTNNAKRLRITNDGNVAVGTDTPLNKFHVEGTGAGSAGIYLNDAVPGTTTNTLYNDGGTLSWDGAAIGNGGAATWIGLTDTDPADYAGSDLKFVKVNATPDGLEFGMLKEDASGNLALGDGSAVDLLIAFDADASDGYIQWKEDEGYFKIKQGIQVFFDATAYTLITQADAGAVTYATVSDGTAEHIFKAAGYEGVSITNAGVQLGGANARVNEFSTDGTLIGASHTAVPTEHAVKSYADGRYAATVINLAFKTWISLFDVDPVNYTDSGGKFVRVNAGETGLEFAAIEGGGGTAHFYNVLDYDVVEGSSDDQQAAIQTLIDAVPSYSVIYFPAGKYNTESGLTVSTAYVVLKGEAGYASQIHNQDDSGSFDFITIAGVEGCGVQDLYIRNYDADATTAQGIVFETAANRGMYSNILIRGMKYGITIELGSMWNLFNTIQINDTFWDDDPPHDSNLHAGFNIDSDAATDNDDNAAGNIYSNIQVFGFTVAGFYFHGSAFGDAALSNIKVSGDSGGATAGIWLNGSDRGYGNRYYNNHITISSLDVDGVCSYSVLGDYVRHISILGVVEGGAVPNGVTLTSRDATDVFNFISEKGGTHFATDLTIGGDLGIGETSPDREIHIKTDGAYGGIVVERTGATASVAEMYNAFDYWISNYTGGGGFRWDINDVEKMKLSAAGALTVVGNITSSGGLCCGLDFVFDSDYPLLGLDELQRFVDKEHHLPNMTINKDNGGRINLGIGIEELLVKVEEHALYILQLHDRLTQLENHLN